MSLLKRIEHLSLAADLGECPYKLGVLFHLEWRLRKTPFLT
jgi:hypothetical protein